MIEILIGGDICPVRKNLQSFRDGNAENIFNDLFAHFENADLSIANLECPLIEELTPIDKSGPVLEVDSQCINGLRTANIDVLNLANNHIMDHGTKGLSNTMELCNKAGILTVGAGETIDLAGRILIKEVKGVRIGILGIAEQEFSIATEKKPGANPLNLISYVRNIKKHKNDFDYLIVLLHMGASGYPVPSPQLMETCRFIVETGANLVVCQHSHCPGSYEKYEGAFIVYGQGNLLFDLYSDPKHPWNQGFIVRITINEAGNHSMDLIPHEQSGEKAGVRKMSVEKTTLFLLEIEERSSKITDRSYIREQWLNLCRKRKNDYYFHFLFGFTNNKLVHLIHRKFPFTRYFFTKRHRLLLHNIIRCETHREIVETIFDLENGNNN